jgi:hypothetical protein
VDCPHCGSINGTVKKAGALKIIHDKFRAKKTADDKERWKLTFARAVESQKELGSYLSKAVHEDLNPAKVLSLFKRMSDEVSTCSSKTVLADASAHPRTVNSSGCVQNLGDLNSTSGNIYLFLQSAFVRLWLRTEPPTRTISPSNSQK